MPSIRLVVEVVMRDTVRFECQRTLVRAMIASCALIVSIVPATYAGTVVSPNDPSLPIGAATYVEITDDIAHTPVYFSNSSDPTGITKQGRMFCNGFGCPNQNNQITAYSTLSTPNAVPKNGYYGLGNGWAQADLASGTLRVYVQSNGEYPATDPYGNNVYYPVLYTTSMASFEDTITAQSDGTIHFALHLTGTYHYAATLASSLYANTAMQFVVSKNGGPLDYLLGAASEPSSTLGGVSYIPDYSAYADAGPHGNPLLDLTLGFDVLVQARDRLDIFALLMSQAANATADLSHTMSLTADGVPFTSNSGVFLTAPVPIPAPVWLLGSNLVALFGFYRRLSHT